MRDLQSFIIWIFSCTIVIAGEDAKSLVRCFEVENHCVQDRSQNIPWCIEHHMKNCSRNRPRRKVAGYYSKSMSESEAKLNVTEGYRVYISSEALNKTRIKQENDVDLIVLLLNKTLFMTNSVSDIIGENVLGVWLGETEIRNLSELVQLRFKNQDHNKDGVCVFWQLDEKKAGFWSTEGCSTRVQNDEFVCSCNHLSFFAVLINPKIPQEIHIVHLSYISYIGSALSIVFTGLVIIIFLWKRKKQSETSVIIHIQLTGSLFLLHISFLCSVWFSHRSHEVCQSLGLVLHWCLLATFSWTAIEGFHLYLLLVQVFNIYIKRYLLKLSLVAWGVPTVTVIICGIISKFTTVYGKYGIHEENQNSTSTSICWITSQAVSFVTVNGYLGLVMIFNTLMLGVVLVKMHQLRSQDVRIMNNKRKVWKDWVSLLGLCCVLGIPWSLAFFTRAPLHLPALYMFTILNSFQGKNGLGYAKKCMEDHYTHPLVNHSMLIVYTFFAIFCNTHCLLFFLSRCFYFLVVSDSHMQSTRRGICLVKGNDSNQLPESLGTCHHKCWQWKELVCLCICGSTCLFYMCLILFILIQYFFICLCLLGAVNGNYG